MFIVLLTSLVNVCSHTKCVTSCNEKCEIQHTLINLHPNEYSQELHYCQFSVKLDRYVGSCNTLNDLSNKVYVPDKTEGFNIHVFNMIIGKKESKMLVKFISCECKCKLHGKKCNLNQKWNNDKCRYKVKNVICEKDYIWNPTHAVAKMVNIYVYY